MMALCEPLRKYLVQAYASFTHHSLTEIILQRHELG